MPANRDIRVEAVTEAVEAKASDSEAAVIDEHVRRPLIGLTPEQLSEVAVSVGLPRFAGKQMARWLYVGRATSVDEMTDLSKQGRIRLAQAAQYLARLDFGWNVAPHSQQRFTSSRSLMISAYRAASNGRTAA